jgi:hypothetical protein|nr:MAG TPA: hypothetical protein [Herelleviridae sp.]
MKRNELIQSVISWNTRFPIDRWWRIKHNVAFMSPAHRESSFIHQLMEFEEDKLFMKEVANDDADKYIPGIGEMFKTAQTHEAFLDEAQREIEEMIKLEGKQNG